MHRAWHQKLQIVGIFFCFAIFSANAQTFQHTDIDYDGQWIEYFGALGFVGSQVDEIYFRINSWRNFIDEGNRLSDPKLKNQAIEKLFANQVSWALNLTFYNQSVAYREIDSLNFRGSPVDTYAKTTLKKVLYEITLGYKRSNQSLDEYDALARRAALRFVEYRKSVKVALDRVVKPRSASQRMGSNGKLSRAADFVNEEIRVKYFGRVAGKVYDLNGKEWINQIYSDMGRASIERHVLLQAEKGNVDSRYLVLIDYIDQNIRFLETEDTLDDESAMLNSTPIRRDEHSGHYVNNGPVHNGSANNDQMRGSEDGLSPRQNALLQEKLKPIYDKCIACHALPTNNINKNIIAFKLITYKTLMHAMRSGEYGTFQKKILPMMSNANTVHIHFNPDEIAAIGDVYRRTKEDENLVEGPYPQAEPKSPEELRYPANSRRAVALKNELVFAATMRCLICHKDPQTEGAESVNTLSKLRAAMRTIDEETIENMIKKGYEHDRLIHIQDLTNVDGKDIPLKTMLLNFAKLPKDRPQ